MILSFFFEGEQRLQMKNNCNEAVYRALLKVLTMTACDRNDPNCDRCSKWILLSSIVNIPLAEEH